MVTNLVTKFFQRVLKLLPALNLLENKVKLDLAANSKTYRTHSNLKLSLLYLWAFNSRQGKSSNSLFPSVYFLRTAPIL